MKLTDLILKITALVLAVAAIACLIMEIGRAHV